MLVSLLLSVLLGDVPPRQHSVTGTITDTAGRAVRGAAVSLRTTLPTGATVRRAVTDDAGAFRITGVAAGPQALRVKAAGFLRPDPIAFAVDDRDPSRDVAVILERGTLRTVHVFDAQGRPAAGARVTCASEGFVRASAETDGKGRAVLATPAGTTVLYAMPPDASFAIRRVAASDNDVRIDVPAAVAALEVATLTTGGEPLPHVGLLVRFNGEIVPPEVARELGRRKMSFRTGEDGRTRLTPLPRGTYELWPYRSDDEAEALMATASSAAAPATVNVLTGDNKVTIRFRRR